MKDFWRDLTTDLEGFAHVTIMLLVVIFTFCLLTAGIMWGLVNVLGIEIPKDNTPRQECKCDCKCYANTKQKVDSPRGE